MKMSNKNIHVLPTEKPSRLCINGKNNQNIYIISDEEIKDGDYFIGFAVTNKKPYISCASEYKARKEDKGKIILTTDQDLIKDGVQAIDDEFLEWFVKNPSCEFIQVEKGYIAICGFISNKNVSKDRTYYKIIIPKEDCENDDFLHKESNSLKIKRDEMKRLHYKIANGFQETLEEVSERKFVKECMGIINQLFDLAEISVEKRQEINDVADKYLQKQISTILKKQDKNKYSEDEVFRLLVHSNERHGKRSVTTQCINTWFEQNKKK